MPLTFYLKHQAPDYYEWLEASGLLNTTALKELEAFLTEGYKNRCIVPNKMDLFKPLYLTRLSQVKVIILGEYPYPSPNYSDGLAFSAYMGMPVELQNIFKCLKRDLNRYRYYTDLKDWAEQGVLLLNVKMTTEPYQIDAHQNRDWEVLTDAIIRLVNSAHKKAVWCLWGDYVKKKKLFITNPEALIIEAPSPTPNPEIDKFLEHKPFSRINEYLIKNGKKPIEF